MSKLQVLCLSFNLKRIHIGLPEVRLVGYWMWYGIAEHRFGPAQLGDMFVVLNLVRLCYFRFDIGS